MRNTLTLVSLAALAIPAAAAPSVRRDYLNADLVARAISSNAADVADKEFDFVIVGGGLAGLVVAGRLAELKDATVLVIEAGGDGSDVTIRQAVPGFTYMRGLAFSSDYSWNLTDVNDKIYPLGRGLGGGAAVNGMYWTRASSGEYDAWETLNGQGSGWGWNDINKYINKAEGASPPPAEQAEKFHITYEEAAHGTTGPLKVGWSSYMYDIIADWVPSWKALGLTDHDLHNGDNRGVTITQSCLNPETQTRADSNDWIDSSLENLHILTHQQVTQIVFGSDKDKDGNLVATGVKFQAGADGQSYEVKAKKEVIVSSGTVGSAKVLQLSGVGPESVLQPLGINVNVDLPVGHNFQDHVMVQTEWAGKEGLEGWYPLLTNSTMQDEALVEWEASKSGPLTYVNSATGYISGKDILGDDAATWTIDTAATVSALATKYNMPESVQKGLAAQYEIQKAWISNDKIAQTEVIMSLWGSDALGVVFESAFQHPWSRGTVMIKSANAFEQPAIDLNFLGVDADIQLLARSIEWTRTLGRTSPIGDRFTGEKNPGADVTGDALNEYIKQAKGTEYHPVGTCSMLPRDMGGVVDTNLLVYGTSNVRVIDASIAPIQYSAHTMATTYGIAEKGADIVKAAFNGVETPASNSTSTSTSTTTGADGKATPVSTAGTGAKPDAKDDEKSAAFTTKASWALVAVGLVASFF